MDSVSDKEIGEIWDRMKKDIPVSELKGETKEEFINNLERKMSDIDKNKKQIQTLLNAGFAERLAETEKARDYFEISEAPAKPPIFEAPARKVFPKNIRPTKTRISVKVKGRFRAYKKDNVILTESSFRGKKAFYVFNKRTNKRLTWGLYK